MVKLMDLPLRFLLKLFLVRGMMEVKIAAKDLIRSYIVGFWTLTQTPKKGCFER